MGFHENAIFPDDISYESRGGPRFSMSVVELASGSEERVARWASPRVVFDAAYGRWERTAAVGECYF